MRRILGNAKLLRHPSILPDEPLKYFDSICIGRGDIQFLKMVSDAEQGNLKNLYQGESGDWVNSSSISKKFWI